MERSYRKENNNTLRETGGGEVCRDSNTTGGQEVWRSFSHLTHRKRFKGRIISNRKPIRSSRTSDKAARTKWERAAIPLVTDPWAVTTYRRGVPKRSVPPGGRSGSFREWIATKRIKRRKIEEQ